MFLLGLWDMGGYLHLHLSSQYYISEYLVFDYEWTRLLSWPNQQTDMCGPWCLVVELCYS